MGTFVCSAGFNCWAAALGVQQGLPLGGLLAAAATSEDATREADDASFLHGIPARRHNLADLTMVATPGVFLHRPARTLYDLSASAGRGATATGALSRAGAPIVLVAKGNDDGVVPSHTSSVAATPLLTLPPAFGEDGDLHAAARKIFAFSLIVYAQEPRRLKDWREGLSVLVRNEDAYPRAHLYVHPSCYAEEKNASIAKRLDAARRTRERAGRLPLTSADEVNVIVKASAAFDRTLPGRLWVAHSRVRRLIDLFLNGSDADLRAAAEQNVDTATGGLCERRGEETGFHNETTQNHFAQLFDVRYCGNPYRECAPRVAERSPFVRALLDASRAIIEDGWRIREEILSKAGLQKLDLRDPEGDFTRKMFEARQKRRLAYLAQEARRANEIVPLLMQMEQIYEAMILLTKEILTLRPGRW